MGGIEDAYEDLETDVSLAEFREAVEAKVDQMGGLADEETAAMLVAHELADAEVNAVDDVEPGMEEVKFVAKVVSIGEARTFERDGEDEPEGQVVNVEVADETGTVRCAFWDERARAVEEELEEGTVLRIKGRPKEGYNGVEVSVDDADPDEDVAVEVDLPDAYRVEDLSLGLSDVNLRGKVLDTESVRTFDRDDGSEGRVANLVLGDETGRIRVTLWDGKAERAEELDAGESVEVVDGYVRERDGSLELHVGEHGAIDAVDEDVEYVPETTPIAVVEMGQTVDVAGVVRSADPKRTFDRDDGSEGQVRNVRIQDDSGDIRVALWGEKADADVGPGDEVVVADAEIQDGWQDDLEASAGWRSTVTVLGEHDPAAADDGDAANAGLGAFASGSDSGSDGGASEARADDGGARESADGGTGDGGADDGSATAVADDNSATAVAGDAAAGPAAEGEEVEFTGTVVQAGDPVILDDGEETLTVETGEDVRLGQEVTARGRLVDGRLDASDVF